MSVDTFINVCACAFLVCLHLAAVGLAVHLLNRFWSWCERYCLVKWGPWGCSDTSLCRGCRQR